MSSDGPAELSRELATLKRRGASLMVVGDGGIGADVCSSLLGAEDIERRGVFVPTSVGVADVRQRWNGPESPDSFAVVDVTGTRGPEILRPTTVGEAAMVPEETDWYEAVSPEAPGALVEAVRRRLERLSADDPPPATIRFCLDSLDPLYDILGEDRLFRLVTTLCMSVTGVRGMAHVHLSPGIPDSVRDTLEPLFDATIEVEHRSAGHNRQRWRLHDSGIETDWLAV